MKYICSVFFLIIFYSAGASVNKHRILMDRTARIVSDTDTIIRKRSVSAGVSYGSDASFFGRTGQERYPFLNANLIYNTKAGIFAYGSIFKVLGSIPVIDETDLGVGYFYKYSKKYSGDISYTRFIFDENAEIIKSASSNDLNFRNTYDWKLFRSSVILDYLFGESDDFFVTLTTSRYFETNWSVFDDKDYLSFTPGINIIFGTQNFVQKYSMNHPGKFQLDNQNIFANATNHKSASENSQFNVLNYSFKIPIAYNRPHYTFEATYRYSIPVNVEGALKNHKESFFNFTFYYVFY